MDSSQHWAGLPLGQRDWLEVTACTTRQSHNNRHRRFSFFMPSSVPSSSQSDTSPTLTDCCFFVVYALVLRWNTTDSELHATDAIVSLARDLSSWTWRHWSLRGCHTTPPQAEIVS
jgi:hypothetical protein